MAKFKVLALSVLISLFLIPVANIFAQEEEVIEDPVLYQEEDTQEEYDYEYEFEYNTEDVEITEEMATTLAAVSVGIWLFIMVTSLASYIFFSFTQYKIGQEMGYKNSWFAWIPILSSIMLFQLGNQNPYLLFLLLLPGIGGLVIGVFSLIAIMNITEKRGYDKLLGLLIFTGIGTYILFYLLAWKPKTTDTSNTTTSQPSLEEQIQQESAATLEEEQPILAEDIQPTTPTPPVEKPLPPFQPSTPPPQPVPPVPPVTQ